MNTKLFFVTLVHIVLGSVMLSCSDDIIVEGTDNLDHPKDIVITAKLSTNNFESRLAFSDNGLAANQSAITMTWEADDSFVFTRNYTSASDASIFKLISGEGTGIGTFEGTDPNPSAFAYNCYYPSTIKYGCDWDYFSYEDQKQIGDNNLNHIKNYFSIWLYKWGDFDGTVSFVNSDHSENNLKQSSCFKFNLKEFPFKIKPQKISLSMVNASGEEVETENSNGEKVYGFHHSNSYTGWDKTIVLNIEEVGYTDKLTAYLMMSATNATIPANSYLRVSVIGENTDGKLVKIYSDKSVGDTDCVLKGGYLHSVTVNDDWNTPYVSESTTVSGNVTKKLQEHKIGEGIKVVFMGDGFSDRQIENGTYEKVMKKGMDAFFSEQPFTYYKDYFDVDMVYAISPQEGCFDEATENLPNNTAFSTWFGEGTHVSGNWDKCVEYAKKVDGIDENNIENTLIIVMMNSTKYAGTCHMKRKEYYDDTLNKDYGEGTSVAYFPIGTSDEALRQVLLHEANGHGFGKLDDEYFYEGFYISSGLEVEYQNMTRHHRFGWYRNVSITDVSTDVYWNDFIDDTDYTSESIGVYEGAHTYYKDFWRPTDNSIMNDNTGGFNAPSRKIIYYRINKLANGDKWEYKHDVFKELDKNWISTSTMSARSVGYVDEEFVPLARPVVTIVDEFGNVISTRR